MADHPFFRPDEVHLSKLRFYSIGIVAANKPLKSMEIEVTPIEELTMLDGEINSDRTTLKVQGENSSGEKYSASVSTANSIKATWLKLGVGNRLTAPDVRRGAQVMIYQFGDSDKYYWMTLKDDMQLRRLETVIWGFTATKEEGADNSAENMYYFEVSTHTQMVTFHTSKANGEFCTYDFQFNTKEGKVLLTDDVGNWFMLDSNAHTLHLENVDGSIIDITKKIATITTLDQINMSATNQINLKTDTYTLTAKTGNNNVDTLNDKGNTWNLQYDTQTLKGNTFTGTISNVTYQGSAFTVQAASIALG